MSIPNTKLQTPNLVVRQDPFCTFTENLEPGIRNAEPGTQNTLK